jgi:hypothetical protein
VRQDMVLDKGKCSEKLVDLMTVQVWLELWTF